MKKESLIHPRLIVHNIFRISFVMNKTINKLLEKEGKMTFSQMRTLMGIMFHPEMSQNDIARFLDVTKAAVSRQIEQLHKKGMLERKINPKNRREKIIALTSNGTKAVKEAFTCIDNKMEELFELVSQNELVTLNKTLHRMIEIIHMSIKTKGRSDPDLDRMFSMKDPEFADKLMQKD